MTHEQIAKVCHQTMQAYVAEQGGEALPNWEQLPDVDKDGYLAVIKARADHVMIAPDQLHVKWMDNRKAAGWEYGESVSYENKKHPNLRPYKELSKDEKFKLMVMFTVTNALTRPKL